MEEIYKKAIKVFNDVRDIPYHISLSISDPCFDCVGKNSILAKRLSEIGYKVRAKTGFFKWSDLDLPADIISIDHDDRCSHYFIEVMPPGKKSWVAIDATWNPELKNLNLPIAEWDGISRTKLAFPCTEILDAKMEEDYEESIDWEGDLERHKNFYQALNNYFDSFLKEGVK